MDQNQNLQENKQNKGYDSDEEDRKNLQRNQTPLERFEMNAPKNSLDQGYCDTFVDQFKGICVKFSYVLIPRSAERSNAWIKDWDLWGPFILCLIFALFIDNADIFMEILFIIFVGAFIVAFNTRILGGNISLLQSVSVLGYCILPLLIAVMVMQFLKFMGFQSRLLQIGLAILATVWCIFGTYGFNAGANSFITVNIGKGKKFISLFPIILFYALLGVYLGFS